MVIIDLSKAHIGQQQKSVVMQPSLIRSDQTGEHLLTQRALWQRLSDDEFHVGELGPLMNPSSLKRMRRMQPHFRITSPFMASL